MPNLERIPRIEAPVDVIIVGAGPAGLAAASCLLQKGRSFVLLDAGTAFERRQRDQAASAICGVGGAGLYSDGKFSFYPSATQLWSLSDRPALEEAYRWLTHLLGDKPVPDFPGQTALPSTRTRRDSRSKRYSSIVVPLPEREGIIRSLEEQVRCGLHTTTHAIHVEPYADSYLVYAESNLGLCIFNAKCVVMAAGRFGPQEMTRMMPKAPAVFRRYELGIRLEQPAEEFLFRDHPATDVKEVAPGPLDNTEWRTFCTCREGEIVETQWGQNRTQSARADGPPTGHSSIGINLRFSAPPDDSQVRKEIGQVLLGQVSPFRVLIRDFLRESVNYFGPRLDAMFRHHISKILPREMHAQALVYGPTVEGVGYYPDINEDLKLNSQEIWLAGDMSGVFRGLTAALVSGHYCASRIDDHLSSVQRLPSFVKVSPSAPMRVAFTAQSKAFFYCRDAVCEFTFRNGLLPLNPFRVFDYFLNDRVHRDVVRQGNNQLIVMADELWVFGSVSDGVLFEIVRARHLRKPVRFFSIATRAEEIKPISPAEVRFEPEVHAAQIRRDDLLALLSDALPSDHGTLGLRQLVLGFD